MQVSSSLGRQDNLASVIILSVCARGQSYSREKALFRRENRDPYRPAE